MLLRWLCLKLRSMCVRCSTCLRVWCRTRHASSAADSGSGDKAAQGNQNGGGGGDGNSQTAIKFAAAMLNEKHTNTFNYWKSMAVRYTQEAEKEAKEKAKQKQVETNLNTVREEQGAQKKSLQRLNDRVIGLEKALIQNQSYLEQIKNIVAQRASTKSGFSERKKSNFIHILARESPYVSTNVPRFFVYEKLVPWECALELYDVSEHICILIE